MGGDKASDIANGCQERYVDLEPHELVPGDMACLSLKVGRSSVAVDVSMSSKSERIMSDHLTAS